eukprot:5438079-Prorocentrum_lima.AAC.1
MVDSRVPLHLVELKNSREEDIAFFSAIKEPVWVNLGSVCVCVESQAGGSSLSACQQPMSLLGIHR